MTQLICQVQRLYLKGGDLVRGGEMFEVEEPTASEYVTGGIAKAVQHPPKQDPPEPEPEPTPIPQPTNQKRRR